MIPPWAVEFFFKKEVLQNKIFNIFNSDGTTAMLRPNAAYLLSKQCGECIESENEIKWI